MKKKVTNRIFARQTFDTPQEYAVVKSLCLFIVSWMYLEMAGGSGHFQYSFPTIQPRKLRFRLAVLNFSQIESKLFLICS